MQATQLQQAKSICVTDEISCSLDIFYCLLIVIFDDCSPDNLTLLNNLFDYLKYVPIMMIHHHYHFNFTARTILIELSYNLSFFSE